MNYTNETTAYIVEKYIDNPTVSTVELLAFELNKSTKSIIGKLSREGVYYRASYTSKTGDKPITKVELVSNISENLGIDIETLIGLEKSPKAALKVLDLATSAQQTVISSADEDYLAMNNSFNSKE